MSETGWVKFYALADQYTDEQVYRLWSQVIYKIWLSGESMYVYSKDEKLIADLDDLLWDYPPHHFIPHCSLKNQSISSLSHIPVLLSDRLEDMTEYNSVFIDLSCCFEIQSLPFSKVCHFFYSENEAEAVVARKLYRSYQKQQRILQFFSL